MILTIIKRIPLIESAFSFPPAVRKRAGKETFFLWFLSSFPILWSLFAKMMSGDSFLNVAAEEVNIKATFVYTSAFLAPMFYILAERILYQRKRKIFAGFYWIFLATLTTMCLSSWLFQNDKIHDSRSWHIASYIMYVVSIYFWWLAIADSRNDEYPYEEEATLEENNFAARASQPRNGDSDE